MSKADGHEWRQGTRGMERADASVRAPVGGHLPGTGGSGTGPQPMVRVASSFNGVGVYSARAVARCGYVADGDCEHVAFHRCLVAHGGRLGVLPLVATDEWRTERPRKGKPKARGR